MGEKENACKPKLPHSAPQHFSKGLSLNKMPPNGRREGRAYSAHSIWTVSLCYFVRSEYRIPAVKKKKKHEHCPFQNSP